MQWSECSYFDVPSFKHPCHRHYLQQARSHSAFPSHPCTSTQAFLPPLFGCPRFVRMDSILAHPVYQSRVPPHAGNLDVRPCLPLALRPAVPGRLGRRLRTDRRGCLFARRSTKCPASCSLRKRLCRQVVDNCQLRTLSRVLGSVLNHRQGNRGSRS